MNKFFKNPSIAKAIWEDEKIYVSYAVKLLKSLNNKAQVLSHDVVLNILNNNAYNHSREPFYYYVNQIMTSKYKENEIKIELN